MAGDIDPHCRFDGAIAARLVVVDNPLRHGQCDRDRMVGPWLGDGAAVCGGQCYRGRACGVAVPQVRRSASAARVAVLVDAFRCLGRDRGAGSRRIIGCGRGVVGRPSAWADVRHVYGRTCTWRPDLYADRLAPHAHQSPRHVARAWSTQHCRNRGLADACHRRQHLCVRSAELPVAVPADPADDPDRFSGRARGRCDLDRDAGDCRWPVDSERAGANAIDRRAVRSANAILPILSRRDGADAAASYRRSRESLAPTSQAARKRSWLSNDRRA